ncbi:hypothetical protein J4417_05065 [Candidatus Woesearchaeota archaeon]|nr:hypothetical protein [Candidatus Woesearchaeota archaeon]
MDKKGQLAWIEIQFVFYGLAAGIILGIVLMILLRQGIIGLNIPFISCPLK